MLKQLLDVATAVIIDDELKYFDRTNDGYEITYDEFRYSFSNEAVEKATRRSPSSYDVEVYIESYSDCDDTETECTITPLLTVGDIPPVLGNILK